MSLVNYKQKKATLSKLKKLMNDETKKIQGVDYDNTLFSQRYLARSHAIVEDLNIEDNALKILVTTRVERVGLLEVQNTLEMLVKHGAGDIPGFTPDGVFDGPNLDYPHVEEPISINQSLFSVDLLLIMKNPEITYTDFTVAGVKFTKVHIHQELEEYFHQTVTLLFGPSDKLYFLSNFFHKNLTVRDAKLILDTIVDGNLTGKAVVGVKLNASSGCTSSVFPVEDLISSYTTAAKEIVFSASTSYIRIPSNKLSKDSCKMLIRVTESGSFTLVLKLKTDTILIYLE
ncbi:hypothetical protein BH753_gp177 [Bacillus phage Shbh1]|uniref:Uncharacterized protein n=1 Tax=Bacillus phage Shbh1 TaxID=1796992 RepID=A0A142F1K2_9CAUD|nr:hypothetical protein BH753_gp177 [Bacillus phage Shbh1]AMQ66659.1 hypothetical protein [Bacillus phage Shbh1]